jgi:hypothetical protein
LAYFTESQLRGFADSPEKRRAAAVHLFESKASAGVAVTIFLSHSHKERKAAQGLINHMASLGVNVYVDWNDSDMPRITNQDTANRIRNKIADLDLVMVLATENGLNSKWVPWEVGVADKTKNDKDILIIPVADYSGRFDGTEYLQLYRRVVIADDGDSAVFKPNQTRGGWSLESYLRNRWE